MIKARYRVIRGRGKGKSRYNNKHEYETMWGRKGGREQKKRGIK